jgi:hypothetical protein
MGPASGPAQLVAALLAARGDLCCSPLSDVAADCSTLGTAVGRRAGAGAGATIVASTFSFDGVHAAVALRAC